MACGTFRRPRPGSAISIHDGPRNCLSTAHRQFSPASPPFAIYWEHSPSARHVRRISPSISGTYKKHVGSPRRWRTVPPEPGEQTGPGSLPGSRQMANSYDRRLASRCSTERPTSSQRPRPPGSSLQPASNPIVPTFAFTRARRTPVITRVKTTKPARPSNASDTIMSSERFVRRAIRSRGNNREHPAKERRDDSESGCRLARRHTDQYQPRQRIRDPQG